MFRLLLALNILCASSLTLNISDIDKFQIENNLNAKISNVIGNFYNNNQFAVTSNISIVLQTIRQLLLLER